MEAFLFNKTLKQFRLRNCNFTRLLEKEKYDHEKVTLHFKH